MKAPSKKSVFDFPIKPKYHPVPRDSQKKFRPENNTFQQQRERMAFYLKRMGWKQKLPSDTKNAFQFTSDGVSMYMNREGIMFQPKREKIDD